MSASISTISPVEPAHRHRERSAQRHQPTALQMGDLRSPLPADAHADDVDAHRRPAAVLAGQPQPGQPAQPAHLVRRHRLLHSAELVTGACLHLDENRVRVRVVGRDDVQLAVAAAPVAVQHTQPQRGQMVDRQLLTQRADLGTGP